MILFSIYNAYCIYICIVCILCIYTVSIYVYYVIFLYVLLLFICTIIFVGMSNISCENNFQLVNYLGEEDMANLYLYGSTSGRINNGFSPVNRDVMAPVAIDDQGKYGCSRQRCSIQNNISSIFSINFETNTG